jgi:hypothetical protein
MKAIRSLRDNDFRHHLPPEFDNLETWLYRITPFYKWTYVPTNRTPRRLKAVSEVGARTRNVTWFQSDRTGRQSDRSNSLLHRNKTSARQGWFGGDGVVRSGHFRQSSFKRLSSSPTAIGMIV